MALDSGTGIHDVIKSGKLKSGVHGFALGAEGTEAGHIVSAHHSADVSVPASRAVSTEATVVPRTVPQLKEFLLRCFCIGYLCVKCT